MRIAGIVIGLLSAITLTAAQGQDVTKGSNSSRRQASGNDQWEKQITIERHFGEGEQWLIIPSGKPAVFRLHRADALPGGGTSKLPRYEVSYETTNMNEAWHGVWFVALGTVAPPVIADLPPWDPNDPKVTTEYNLKLTPLHQVLLIPHLDPARDWARLEGFMPVLWCDHPGVDRVRMIYLNNAVTDKKTGVKSDLVLITLAFADGSPATPCTENHAVRENGGASGPPH